MLCDGPERIVRLTAPLLTLFAPAAVLGSASAQTTGSHPAPATQPTVQVSPVEPADLIAGANDYRIAPDDLLAIGVSEISPGKETTWTKRVGQRGTIALPYVGEVHAAGHTEDELAKAIARAFQDENVIAHAAVDVRVLEAPARTFDVLGAVHRQGHYPIATSNFRLLDALATARGTQGPVEKLRILRPDPAPATRPASGGAVPRSVRVLEIPVAPLLEGAELNIVMHPGDVVVAIAPTPEPKPAALPAPPATLPAMPIDCCAPEPPAAPTTRLTTTTRPATRPTPQ